MVPTLRFRGFAGEWWKKSLKEVSEKSISYGIVQTGEHVEHGVRCVRVVDLTKPQMDVREMITTTREISRSYKRTILVEGEIMVALRGEIGLVARVPKFLEGSNLTRGVARIAPKRSEVVSEFLVWGLRTEGSKIEFLKQVNGSALKEIPINGLNKVEVPVTTIPEQQKIAEFMSVVDARIQQLIQKKALLEEYKKGVMQQIFTHVIRFKDDDGNDFPEWEEKRLGDIADVKTGPFGSTLHESDYSENGTPIITVEHLSDHGLVHRNLPFVSDKDKERLKSYVLQENDIVFSRVGSVDRNSLVNRIEAGWLFSGRILRIRVNSQVIDPKFLSFYFQLELTKHRIRSVAVGQTMASLNTEILKDFHIVSADLKEQFKIASFLSAIDSKIVVVAAQITHAQTFKKGLLQQMFV